MSFKEIGSRLMKIEGGAAAHPDEVYVVALQSVVIALLAELLKTPDNSNLAEKLKSQIDSLLATDDQVRKRANELIQQSLDLA